MMILVDTSVWIDFLLGESSPHVKALEDSINQRTDLCICGIILTEVLQGIHDEKEYTYTKNLFENLIFLPLTYAIYSKAEEMYRTLRKKGIIIKKALDCIIASLAIENDLYLLHHDKDFIAIKKYYCLKTIR